MRYVLRRRLTLRGYKWTWHLKAGNGEIIAHGESYSRHIDCLRAIELVKGSADAVIEDRS